MPDNPKRVGWAVPPPVSNQSIANGDSPTRLVPASFPSATFGASSDATVLAKKAPVLGQKTNRQSAQYIPITGLRDSSDATRIWTQESTDSKVAVRRILRSLAGDWKQRRIRVLAIASIPLLIVLGLAVWSIDPTDSTNRDSKGAGQIPSSAQAMGTPGAEETPETKWRSPPKKRPIAQHAPIKSVRLKQAADALVQGNFCEALGLYRSLEARFPGDPSFSLAVEVLSRSEKGDSK